MQIRVAAPDATSAGPLLERLVRVVDTTAVRLDGAWAEVTVSAEAQADRLIAQVLFAVESWLDDVGVDSAEVRLGERSHVLARVGSSASRSAG